MFWLDITTGRPPEDLKAPGAYCPDLDNAQGWMDIIYLSCMILLFPALDLRNYTHEDIPADDLSEVEAANTKYVLWRQWLAENYACFNNAQKPLDWESEIFSVTFPTPPICLSTSNRELEIQMLKCSKASRNKPSHRSSVLCWLGVAVVLAVAHGWLWKHLEVRKLNQPNLDGNADTNSGWKKDWETYKWCLGGSLRHKWSWSGPKAAVRRAGIVWQMDING
ncbi:hypothetical protein B0H19DRAFT_1062747 [Mycena capillaripes]|nr:hypothetical protein B0H19DRAFT_1062747 [Mycena capillaripes]